MDKGKLIFDILLKNLKYSTNHFGLSKKIVITDDKREKFKLIITKKTERNE